MSFSSPTFISGGEHEKKEEETILGRGGKKGGTEYRDWALMHSKASGSIHRSMAREENKGKCNGGRGRCESGESGENEKGLKRGAHRASPYLHSCLGIRRGSGLVNKEDWRERVRGPRLEGKREKTEATEKRKMGGGGSSAKNTLLMLLY